ncbi:MAG: helix-turn-helix domain-containing protein [Devosia sp.]
MTIDRRREILDAALSAFLEKGYAATSIADIRARSGASTGSIYHFFSGKGALAEALLHEAVSGWARQSTAALDPAASPEAALKASVRGLMLWGFSHPEQFRFMDEIRTLAPTDPDFSAVRDLLDDGQAVAAGQYGRMIMAGAVRNIPFSIAYALMLGPAYAYLRRAGTVSAAEAGRVAELFAGAAWDSVRA